MKTLIKLTALTIILSILVSCEKDDNAGDPSNNTGQDPVLSVKMVDAPADYDAVNVEVLALRARVDSAWIELPAENPAVYNLLDLANGNSVLLVGDTAVVPGTLSELRLLLGNNNSVVVDGQPYELKTPSGQTSGYKIKMDPQVLEEDRIYAVMIDFDVSQSVHQTGNGRYMLKPVVRGYLEFAIGSISGVVDPPAGAYYVQASNAVDTAGTMIDTLTGEFLISTVLPGIYDVEFSASEGFSDTTITDIEVFAGEVTQMDTLFIE